MTWNLWHQLYAERHGVPQGQELTLSPNWADRLPIARRAIEEMHPDILCLQEIDQKMAADILTHLQTVGLHYAMTCFAQHRARGKCDGVTVLYNQDRFQKITEKTLQAKSNNLGTAQVDLLDRTTQQVIRVASIHLQFQNFGEDQLKEVVESFQENPQPLQILAGDFNREMLQLSSTMREFANDDNVLEETSMNKNGRTSKIDHIFVQQTRPESCCIKSWDSYIHQESKLRASDHSALIMDLTYSYTPAASDRVDSASSSSIPLGKSPTSSPKPATLVSCWTTFFSFLQRIASVFLSLICCRSYKDRSIDSRT